MHSVHITCRNVWLKMYSKMYSAFIDAKIDMFTMFLEFRFIFSSAHGGKGAGCLKKVTTEVATIATVAITAVVTVPFATAAPLQRNPPEGVRYRVRLRRPGLGSWPGYITYEMVYTALPTKGAYSS